MSGVTVKTGDVWLANLDPTVGSEIQKTRPCVVISPAEMHDYLRTVIVAPMTTGSRSAGFRIPLTFQGKSGLILLDQIRTLDKARLVKKLAQSTASRWRKRFGPCKLSLSPPESVAAALTVWDNSHHERQYLRISLRSHQLW